MIMKYLLYLLLLPTLSLAQSFSPAEVAKWKQQAQRVTIIRDKWGIPHVYGKTDADAVFGLLFAQCEDDFPRVEANYIEKLGRQAEVQGSKALYEDLLHRLVLDSAAAKKDFATAKAKLAPVIAEAETVTVAPAGKSAAYGQAFYLMGMVRESEGQLPEALRDYLSAVTLFHEDKAIVAQAQERANVLITEKKVIVP